MDLLQPIQPVRILDHEMVVTTNDLPGYKIVKIYGMVKGISVRTRNICANICACLCSLAGGKNSILVSLCEQTREEALQICLSRAQEKGANALIGMRYEAHEIFDGCSEVLAYGTAVFATKIATD